MSEVCSTNERGESKGPEHAMHACGHNRKILIDVLQAISVINEVDKLKMIRFLEMRLE